MRIGADEVHQCSLEEMAKLPASQIEIDESLEEGVLFNAGWGPISIEETDGKVTGIVLKKKSFLFLMKMATLHQVTRMKPARLL